MIKNIFLLICTLQLLGCSSNPNKKMCIEKLDQSISEFKINDTINFQKINCFEWDSLMILNPTFSFSQIEKKSGVILPDNFKNSNLTEWSYWTVLFLKNHKVIEQYKIKRTYLDFNDLGAKRNNSFGFFVLRKEDAVITGYIDSANPFVTGKRNMQARLAILK